MAKLTFLFDGREAGVVVHSLRMAQQAEWKLLERLLATDAGGDMGRYAQLTKHRMESQGRLNIMKDVGDRLAKLMVQNAVENGISTGEVLDGVRQCAGGVDSEEENSPAAGKSVESPSVATQVHPFPGAFHRDEGDKAPG